MLKSPINQMAVISVSQLNRYVASLLDSNSNLSNVQVIGEISSFRKYPSGHLYFNLKDINCSVSCVMFKSQADLVRFKFEDGQRVVVEARASLYDRDGKFQLYVNAMKQEGIGDLFVAFERLKEKLESEGLFNPAFKKRIPYLPKKIGVATSSSGAVIRDIIHVLKRRFPGFQLLLIPVKVQGDGAAAQIVHAIETFNQRDDVDVIIIGRGGGSMEDLWCFNDETLARAVFASRIPVISAVGHETDFTICDFVADLRAPTPSAAAELVVPVREELEERLMAFSALLRKDLMNNLDYSRLRLQNAINSTFFVNPLKMTESRTEQLLHLSEKLHAALDVLVNNKKSDVIMMVQRLDLLSPLKVLSRGYGIIENLNKSVRIVQTSDVSVGDSINITLSDGDLRCSVLSKKRKGETNNG